ncbi:hypothetical protein [Legionella impletisoli]|uniref:Uncharacterized protein n=1 Tax=Legionella impletisoli TaxID=343510 RepID=A0A917JPN6_9GAMM|nr:hypothetical protein [Legionella impletisoli]GGI77265.1 hypothetical protein GCM10007966_02470 [Legionella impletisoli]
MGFTSSKLVFIISKYFKKILSEDSFQAFSLDNSILYKGESYHPTVIHFPGGKRNRFWLDYFLNQLNKKDSFSLTKPDNVHILQLNNYVSSDMEINPAEYFLKKAGLDYCSLGKAISPSTWRNSVKISLLNELLQNIPNSETPQYFLAYDSSDAVLIGECGTLIQALNEYRCNILFGLDSIIYNGFHWKKNVINTPKYMREYLKNHYRFLNSGMIFGEVEPMKRVLSFLLHEYSTNGLFPHFSDQHYYHQARFEFPEDIGVDYKKKYLLNIFHFTGFFERFQ